MKKLLISLILGAFVVLMGWQIYKRVLAQATSQEQRPRTAVVPVEVSPITKGTIQDIGMFTGTLFPKSQYLVAPKISGRLERLRVDIGDLVKRGDLIAALDDDEIVQQLDQTRAELAVAKANLEETRSALDNAQREYDRVKALRDKKIASQSELDTAEANLTAAEAKQKVAAAQINQKEAALKADEVRLSYTKIVANWDTGPETRIVGERYVDEGTMLAANSPIVSILEVGTLIAVIQVIERDYTQVQIGQEATVTTDAFPGRTFTGRISRIAPLLKESSRQARVEIELDNTDESLKPGMFVRVEIEFKNRTDAILVPTSALAKRDDQQGVFLADLERMTAHFVPVQFGIINAGLMEVLDPPLSGWVVTLGQHLLEDGASIVLPPVEGSGFGREPSKAQVPSSTSTLRGKDKQG